MMSICTAGIVSRADIFEHFILFALQSSTDYESPQSVSTCK